MFKIIRVGCWKILWAVVFCMPDCKLEWDWGNGESVNQFILTKANMSLMVIAIFYGSPSKILKKIII